ncbi:nitrate- and nitrite sensing domain-containing protein [Nonomuraea sp. NPDC050536]|uniref:sensor histidine kinase n=1 Tax=Nonomuraea sp. NPDC050536 TaxID=3364366 RepID=UPI0037CBB414
MNLLWVNTLDEKVGRPTVSLVTALQTERQLSLSYLGGHTTQRRDALTKQRTQTDQARAAFEEDINSYSVRVAADDALERRLDDSLRALQTLDKQRKSIDSGALDRTQASAALTEIVDTMFLIYGSEASIDDQQIAKDARTLIAFTRAKEVLSREDALLAGAQAAGSFSTGEYDRFAALVGSQRFLHNEAAAELPDADRARYKSLTNSAAFQRFRALEDRVIENGRDQAALPVTNREWQAGIQPVLSELEKFLLVSADGLVERATPVAVGVIVRLVLAGGLGLFAVVASIILSITTTRALLAQLTKLRDAAHELSDDRLPGVVERIGRGEEVDLAREVPALEFGDDEIGQVGQAFNTVQRTAVAVAAEQAELRRGIRDILLSLARRTQGLVHRQLTVLDVMERRETDPEELKELFRLDHLAIRMRRNAENLIVLSGSSPARTWRRSVPMVDVVRGALAEVEDYTRVTLMPMGEVVLVGRAVGDVIHLLAEVIENAVSFSPPYTNVQVSGQLVANGYVVEIEDRGLGMKAEDLDAANERIADPPEFRISGTARLGLYVVSRLAERHGIQVVLKASPYGGTTVVVLLPQELVELSDGAQQVDGGQPETGLPRRKSAVATATRENVRTLRSARPRDIPARRPDDTAEIPVRPVTAEEQPASPETPVAQAETELTPGGLPMRVPQANLAPALREEPPPATEEDDDERSPEEIRAMMGSLQSGTRLGRSEAAKLLEEEQ